jgi:hypothetical protein
VNKTDDNRYIEPAISGDIESFGRLCKKYYPVMVGIAYCYLNDRDLAEDAVQEAFYDAFCCISKLSKPERFYKWLSALCRNTAIDIAKANKRQEKIYRKYIEQGNQEKENSSSNDIDFLREVIRELPALQVWVSAPLVLLSIKNGERKKAYKKISPGTCRVMKYLFHRLRERTWWDKSYAPQAGLRAKYKSACVEQS